MKSSWTLLLICSVLLSSCSKEARWDCFKSSGSATEETRLLDSFQHLEINDDVKVILVPDSVNKVRIVAWENLIDQIEVKVSQNTLTLRNNNRCNWVRKLSKHPLVYVHFKELTALTQYSSEDLTTSDTITTKTFDYNQWSGGSNVELLLNTKECFARIHTGTGMLVLKGRSEVVYSYSASNGFLDLSNFRVQNAATNNYGTGDISVFASELLEVNLYGVGNVIYFGSPPIIKANVTGQGQLLAH